MLGVDDFRKSQESYQDRSKVRLWYLMCQLTWEIIEFLPALIILVVWALLVVVNFYRVFGHLYMFYKYMILRSTEKWCYYQIMEGTEDFVELDESSGNVPRSWLLVTNAVYQIYTDIFIIFKIVFLSLRIIRFPCFLTTVLPKLWNKNEFLKYSVDGNFVNDILF